jgi:glycosyltransferase involved in cell wall biosynthesis
LAGKSENIRFLGPQSGSRLQALYRQAMAVIVPSLAFEMSPLVIPEAFQQKTPVIVRQLGGLPEIIRASGGGFIYQTDDDLDICLQQLISNPALRDSMGQQGYHAFQKFWSADAHLKKYFSLIQEISSQKGGS